MDACLPLSHANVIIS